MSQRRVDRCNVCPSAFVVWGLGGQGRRAANLAAPARCYWPLTFIAARRELLELHMKSKISEPRRRGQPVRVPVRDAREHPLPPVHPTEFIREPELRITMLGGIGATTLRRMVADAGFPAPIRLTERICVWSVPAVRAWIAAKEGAQ